MQHNRKAFLDMLAFSEGTLGVGNDGYNVLVGSTKANPKLFKSYADHPRVLVDLPKLRIKSTAAGRYQILMRTYDAYAKLLKLSDFSPASQDAIAMQLIKECRAIPDIDAGNFRDAVNRCAHIWASLPGAGYGQHENSMDRLQMAFVRAGGMVV